MAKRYNHRALTEALKQGQARMMQTMTEAREKSAPGPAESRKQSEREHAHVGIGMIPARRKKKFRVHKNYIIFTIVFVVLAAIVYWSGKNVSSPAGEKTASPGGTEGSGQEMTGSVSLGEEQKQTQEPKTATPGLVETAETRPLPPARPAAEAAPEKDHVIVIATYTKREHLLPAQDYFDKNGVKTEIMRRGSYYLLVTSRRFDSPLKEGTDGRQMLQKIKMLGRQYKAPDGYENFGRTPFQDAYGMKIKE